MPGSGLAGSAGSPGLRFPCTSAARDTSAVAQRSIPAPLQEDILDPGHALIVWIWSERRKAICMKTNSVRRLLNEFFKTSSELDAFMLDHFPDTMKIISNSMDRVQKTNILFEKNSLSAIIKAMQSYQCTSVDDDKLANDLKALLSAEIHTDGLNSFRRRTQIEVAIFIGSLGFSSAFSKSPITSMTFLSALFLAYIAIFRKDYSRLLRGLFAGFSMVLAICCAKLVVVAIEKNNVALLESQGNTAETSAEFRNGQVLLDAIPKIECQGKDACLRLAHYEVSLARKIEEMKEPDFSSIYNITKHLHRAYYALGEDPSSIPDLPKKYEQARLELMNKFSDLHFRYQIARRNENRKEELSILESILPICKEERHSFCANLELSYRLLRN